MSGFGDNLRTERQARGVSLEDISSATKISVRLLQAIENEDFGRLPGGVFNVNFVRQYARHLGLEEESVVSEYRRLTAPLSPEPQPETTAQRQPIIRLSGRRRRTQNISGTGPTARASGRSRWS
jgi:cytoskeleton protein RodZ